MDRHYNELVEELRVAQTGVQILFAFLFGLAFTPRFPRAQRRPAGMYLATLVLAAVLAALLIGPVGYHRTVFPTAAAAPASDHRAPLCGRRPGPAAAGAGRAVHRAASFVLGAWASLLAVALAGLFALLWFVISLSTWPVPAPADRDQK